MASLYGKTLTENLPLSLPTESRRVVRAGGRKTDSLIPELVL